MLCGHCHQQFKGSACACLANQFEPILQQLAYSDKEYHDKLRASGYGNQAYRKSPEEAGREHWTELHTYEGNDPEWLADWESRIPSYGCSCRQEYAKIKADFPPCFDSPMAFRLWGFVIHNQVNKRLGKKYLTLAECIGLWGLSSEGKRTDGTSQI